MEFEDYQKWVDCFYKTRGWYQLPSSVRLNFLTEEVGELSQAIRRYEIGRDRPDEPQRTVEENHNAIKEELADVLDNILILASKYEIDITDMLNSHIVKFEERFIEQ